MGKFFSGKKTFCAYSCQQHLDKERCRWGNFCAAFLGLCIWGACLICHPPSAKKLPFAVSIESTRGCQAPPPPPPPFLLLLSFSLYLLVSSIFRLFFLRNRKKEWDMDVLFFSLPPKVHQTVMYRERNSQSPLLVVAHILWIAVRIFYASRSTTTTP